MTCPHCASPLSFIGIDTTDGQTQNVNECLNCGGHFLPPYMANFLSVETAKNIDSVLPKSKFVPTSAPICPKCGQNMSSIKDDSVPETVTVFTCPNNHGDFFPKNQLLNFKKAQQAKIYYHKVWGIPLKTAFAVMIPLFMAFTAVTVLPSVIQNLSTQETRVKASDILTPPLITPISNTQILISFSTQKKAKTTIRFIEGMEQTITVSETDQINHLLSVDNLTPGTLYKYIIDLNQNGKITSTSVYTFATP